MIALQCIPIDTATADRFRSTGRDDADNRIRSVIATDATGYPCRHCLRSGKPGETMLLGSYHLPRPRGIYWTPSPIFVHADRCPRFDETNAVAPIVRTGSLLSLRAYDGDEQCLYDLGVVCGGESIDEPLERALHDPRSAFVNIHTARPGCLLTRIERIAASFVVYDGQDGI